MVFSGGWGHALLASIYDFNYGTSSFAKLSDYIKRSRILAHRETMGSRGESSGTGRNQSRGSTGGSPIDPSQVRRGDLFGTQEYRHVVQGGIRIRENRAFEASPASNRIQASPLAAARRTSLAGIFQNAAREESSDPASPQRNAAKNSGHERSWQQSPRVNNSQERERSVSPRDRRSSPLLPASPEKDTASQGSLPADQHMGDEEQQEDEIMDDDNLSLSSFDMERKDEEGYNEARRWKIDVMREVSAAYAKIPDKPEVAPEHEVVVEHTFDFDAQLRFQERKRRLEDCGVVFCTVDLSPSRDTFLQWIYREVENKAAVQSTHVKVLAPSYLVLMRSMQDRNAILAGGPYYMRRRMVYIVPWEPRYDTKKTLAKKMACWLDLLDVDPMLEGEGENLLASLGNVLRTAGISENEGGKFQNVRGCILMDMTKPLPTVLNVKLNRVVKKIHIRYDVLPDACFNCYERGHFARICPKGKPNDKEEEPGDNQAGEAEFETVPGGQRRNGTVENSASTHTPQVDPQNVGVNPYAVLAVEDEELDTPDPQAEGSGDNNINPEDLALKGDSVNAESTSHTAQTSHSAGDGEMVND
ncbi:hypothetical protein R1sor_011161 [Riccia sorocarpa]|uniref:CCHC-type domain-containing protein n=1 Tax=Riccia sorocarpa TaxID=122646 RepID=A0ABD3I405_9MARC